MPNLDITGGPSFAVPASDSADNYGWGDVIGSKTDTWQGSSLYAMLLSQYIHINTETLVYPTLAAGAPVVSPLAAWAWGGYATIVPAGAIATEYHPTALSIETCDQNGVFEIELYKGAADDLIAAVRFSVFGGFFGNARYPISTVEVVEAGARLRARLASNAGAIATITVSIEYYTL